MKNVKQAIRKIFFTNSFGAVGYTFCLLQWAWTLLLFVPALLESDFGQSFLRPQETTPLRPETSIEPSIPMFIFIACITVTVILATIWVAIKMPSTIVKTGKKITHTATDKSVALISRHKPISETKKRVISSRLLALIKVGLCTIPFGLLFVAPQSPIEIAWNVTIVIGAGLCLIALICFSLQALIARLMHVPYNKTW